LDFLCELMLKLCFEVTLLSVCFLVCLFQTSVQAMQRAFLYVFPFLLFFHSTYMYFPSLAGPIYNIGCIYIYIYIYIYI
jgi:hypothetical protein